MDPTQTPVQIPDFQPKPNYLKTIIFSVLVVITLGLVTYLLLQNQKLQKQVLNLQISPTIQVPSPVSQSVSLTPKTSITIPPDETIDWKIYTSTKLNLSFKYPSEYKTPEENNNYISLISPLNPEPKKGYELQNEELKIEIYVSDAEPNETLIELIKKKKEQSDSLGADVKIIKEEDILVDGIKAVKQTWEGMGTGQTILFINNNKEYGIIKYPAVTIRDNEFDQILSTFKFTSKN